MDNTTAENRQRFREARQLQGFTQMELAQEARISHSKISLFENGVVDLTPKEHARLKKVLSKRGRSTISLASPANRSAELESLREAESVAHRSVYRKQTGMSLRAFARAAKIPVNKLCKWESDKAKLSSEETARWLQTYQEGERKQQQSDPWWLLDNALRAMAELQAEDERKASGLEAVAARAGILDDPIVSEIIQSFRREIAQLETQTAEPATDPGPSLALRIYGKMLVGKPITDEEFAEARAAIADVKKTEAD
jgi:transcriptional regulator with XRE-family HTH domain